MVSDAQQPVLVLCDPQQDKLYQRPTIEIQFFSAEQSHLLIERSGPVGRRRNVNKAQGGLAGGMDNLKGLVVVTIERCPQQLVSLN